MAVLTQGLGLGLGVTADHCFVEELGPWQGCGVPPCPAPLRLEAALQGLQGHSRTNLDSHFGLCVYPRGCSEVPSAGPLW